MKRNLYYRHVYKRTNAFKEFVLMFFLSVSSWPRLTVELFTRHRFGVRYFTWSGSVVFVLLLAAYPVVKQTSLQFLLGNYYGPRLEMTELVKHYFTWYAYLGAMLYMAYIRRDEINREPGDFDFEWFSLSAGIIDNRFLNIDWGGKPVTIRTVETLIEPGLFFCGGLALWLLGQSLGSLLMICAVIYGLSYRAQYYIGDNFILDKSDELIANRQLHNTYVNDMHVSETQGFQVHARRPSAPDYRRDLADMMMVSEEAVEAV